MRELRLLMESMGLSSVSTYIQSGNVVFRTPHSKDPGLRTKIEDSIVERFGFRPEVFILEGVEIDRAISENPYPEADSEPNRVHLMFLSAAPRDPDLAALERIRKPNERFLLRGKVFYFHAPDGIGTSKLAARVENSLGVSGTSRNWRTVLKLREMVQASAA